MSKDKLNELKIFTLSSNPILAEKIAEHTGVTLGDCSVKTFSDGEVQINIEESVRGCDVYVIQSTSDPANQHIMELLIMLDALKRASPKTINVVIPYYGYARQDRKTKAREPIAAKLIADLIEKSGASRVMSLDIHATQTQGFFDVPVDPLTGIPILAAYFSDKKLEDIVVVAPDHGSVKRARQFADRMEAPIAILDRRGPRDVDASQLKVVGDIEGKTAIIIDDIVDTGRRVTTGAQALMDNGAKEVYATCTHPVLSGIATEKINASPIKELVITDTIPIPEEKWSNKMTQLSTAALFSEAILRVYRQESVSPLFDV
ncbi:Ribose-phosphate pyrophosphokinase [Paraliobacillus sp. PM-2]|uniref:ribose-phosphate diphosphokinase n=1 Tax=Paraliobacillus sp. PM-2 TaxID=1462524 RepID=UPI00061C56D1|nr:ribose-phosphate pyrophosphokinase [Paraliobacillus sp. PM-2]CQR46368.1 Ribose-phosphate pyrophosphokinase [Paraliobacillus sp. PM-2]